MEFGIVRDIAHNSFINRKLKIYSIFKNCDTILFGSHLNDMCISLQNQASKLPLKTTGPKLKIEHANNY